MGNIAGAPPVFGAPIDRFEVQSVGGWRFYIVDLRLMKTVEGSVTPNEEEALALCKLMNEGEKL